MKLKLKTEVILIYFSPRYCNFRQWPLILRGQNVTYSAMFKVGHDPSQAPVSLTIYFN